MSDIFDDRKKALEEEYFRRKEQESIEKLRQKMEAARVAEVEEARLIECPRGHGKMAVLNFEGVEIDRCDTCSGVWLDQGELEQLRKTEVGGWLSNLWRSKD